MLYWHWQVGWNLKEDFSTHTLGSLRGLRGSGMGPFHSSPMGLSLANLSDLAHSKSVSAHSSDPNMMKILLQKLPLRQAVKIYGTMVAFPKSNTVWVYIFVLDKPIEANTTDGTVYVRLEWRCHRRTINKVITTMVIRLFDCGGRGWVHSTAGSWVHFLLLIDTYGLSLTIFELFSWIKSVSVHLSARAPARMTRIR